MKTDKTEQPAASSRRYLPMAAVAAVAFVAAFAVAWLVIPRTPPAPAPAAAPEPVTLAEEDLAPFFRAVEAGDFAAMRDIGDTLLVEGATIPGSGRLLEGYETNTFSEFRVYALHSDVTNDRTRRVLLTVDGNDRVVSFLAEEMAVAR